MCDFKPFRSDALLGFFLSKIKTMTLPNLLTQIKRAGHTAIIKGDSVLVTKQGVNQKIGLTHVGIMVEFRCRLKGTWIEPKPNPKKKDAISIKYLIQII